MKIDNQTQYPTRDVERVILQVARDMEVDKTKVMMRVKHHRSWRGHYGRFYALAPVIYDPIRFEYRRVDTDGEHRLITMRIPKPKQFEPYVDWPGYSRKEMPPLFVVATWQESLAAIAGHELHHLAQYVRPSRTRRRGRFNEVDTQFAEYRAWKRWRAAHPIRDEKLAEKIERMLAAAIKASTAAPDEEDAA